MNERARYIRLKRIWFFGVPQLWSPIASKRRLQAIAAMSKLGLEQGDHTMEAGMEATPELIASVHRPSAVVCSNDLTAIGVIRKASELSFNIPGDLSVSGLMTFAWRNSRPRA